MKKYIRNFIVGSLAAMMTLSIAACGKGGEGTGSGNGGGADDGKVTLTIWNSEITSPGVQTNDVAKKLEEKTGVTMDIVQGDAEKFSILVAGGDLPDIIYSNPAQQGVTAKTLISGGHLIALDDLIEQYGENTKKHFPSMLDYSRQFLSNGEHKVYLLPVNGYNLDEENPDISYSIANVGIMVRFDVYAAIGYPEINTTDDFLNVLKQMQDYANENDLAEGKQVYAISGWSDWGLWPWWLANSRGMGYEDMIISNTVLNAVTDEVELLFNSDMFWNSLEFFNKAYNMGIVDPEAFTMKNDQFWEKSTNGQVLMAHASWQTESINKSVASNGHPEWGYEKLPFDGYDYISGIVASDAPLGRGSDYAAAITKNCKNPEAAMRFLDYCRSEEGSRLIYSGVEGEQWESVDNVPGYTDAFDEMMKTDSEFTNKTGVTLYNKLAGFAENAILSDGYPANLLKSNEEKAKNLLPIDEAYCSYYGTQFGKEYSYPGQVLADLMEEGKVKSLTDFRLYTTLVTQPGDETENILAQADQYMNVQGVKMITAETPELFEQYKQEAEEALANLNYGKAVTEVLGLFEAAKQEAGGFKLQ